MAADQITSVTLSAEQYKAVRTLSTNAETVQIVQTKGPAKTYVVTAKGDSTDYFALTAAGDVKHVKGTPTLLADVA